MFETRNQTTGVTDGSRDRFEVSAVQAESSLTGAISGMRQGNADSSQQVWSLRLVSSFCLRETLLVLACVQFRVVTV